MYELSVACKYLIPRRRQLSVSIISLISVLVIALVVWLIVVFFSVTDGLEKSWVQKLTALTAPVRITPTEAYFHSYYYQIDGVSEEANYSLKTIREKKESPLTDPYNSEVDQEIPSFWPGPDRDSNGEVKDLVKSVYSTLDEMRQVPGIRGQDFEFTATNLHLHLMRRTQSSPINHIYETTTHSTLSYPAYLGNFEEDNPHLKKTLLPVEKRDLNNLLSFIGITNNGILEESNDDPIPFKPDILHKRLTQFFDFVNVQQLKTRPLGWAIPQALLPLNADWKVCIIFKNQQPYRAVVPLTTGGLTSLRQNLEEQGMVVAIGQLIFREGHYTLQTSKEELKIPPYLQITLRGGSFLNATLDASSIAHTHQVDDLLFDVALMIQEHPIQGKIPYKGLEIAQAEFQQNTQPSQDYSPLWISELREGNKLSFLLPKDADVGEAVVLPKSFRDVGVLIGDRGSLSYYTPTASILQEQKIPITVAGFYDPGIIPIGGKFILASPDVTSLIRSAHSQHDNASLTNGINVRFDRLEQADEVKSFLINAFKTKGINQYWNVETYRDYEFTKEIIGELQSQKNLFLLIAIVIIVVACSNIISMLVILVNDKKLEIGILRSMGATSKSIALIFGLAGALIGVLGSALGIGAAILTLSHLGTLIGLLSAIQGHQMFSVGLYGQVLPHELSMEALLFVLIATVCISLLAGIVPAIKACLLKPSHILRSSGG